MTRFAWHKPLQKRDAPDCPFTAIGHSLLSRRFTANHQARPGSAFMAARRSLLAALLLLGHTCWPEALAEPWPEPSVHTVFTTECTPYFNWQTLGLLFSHHKSGQPGPVTRLLSCTPQALKTFKDLEGVNTHVAPSWTVHPITGDVYR